MPQDQQQPQAPARQREDVVDLLLQQHEEIRDLFARVERAGGERRREAFEQLVRLLAAHETAEEMVVHPRARTTLPNGDRVVNARLDEEREAKRLLSRLDRIGVYDADFEVEFKQLREAVIGHAEHEEREEFPALRRHNSVDQLRGMATLVRAARAVAPTHPHPGVESARANVIVGPAAAVADRVRDTIRRSRGRAAETIEESAERLSEQAQRVTQRTGEAVERTGGAAERQAERLEAQGERIRDQADRKD